MPQSGIYGIFNMTNGKVLVGSSQDIPVRFKNHRNEAKRGEHYNPHFQRAWNLNGEASFEFRILEECSVDMLLVREDAWMNHFNSLNDKFGYNTKNANRPIFSTETRQKISEANRHRVYTQETIEKLRKAATGKHLSSERKAKLLSFQTHSAMTGKKHSQEVKTKISNSMHVVWNKRKVS